MISIRNALFHLIGLTILILSSCSGPPKRYLATSASLINPGHAKEDVTQLMGPPDASRVNQEGEEEWYYYNKHRSFTDNIPVVRSIAGSGKVEALQVVISGDKVKKVQYYVPVP